MTVDDIFDFYISTNDSTNGTLIGSDGNWATSFNYSALLTSGVTNYIHIIGVDVGSISAFIGEFSLSDTSFHFANGTQLLKTNTVDWQVSETGFGMDYAAPMSQGLNGEGPWGEHTDMASDAEWIWAPSNCTNCTVYFSASILPSPSSNFSLNVTKPGTGSGTVTSVPTGINCGATCNANFAANTNVILTAAPAVTSNFVNWSGACSGTAVTCTVAMSAAKSVAATFNLIPVITPPTAITNAASNITVNSTKLNGSVKSNGATTAVSFDFGLTTTYGTSIAATPSTVFSNTAVAVAANKAGLTCGTTYHYRVKAVNSKGTGYGADKAFATTSCPIRRDLVVTGVTLTPAIPVANGAFNVAVTVKNAGTATSNIGFFVDVWANSTAVPGCGAEGDGWVETPMLAAGTSRIVTVTGLKAGTAGAKTLRAFVDSWCEVVESNETNNQMVKAYSVQ